MKVEKTLADDVDVEPSGTELFGKEMKAAYDFVGKLHVERLLLSIHF